MQPDQTTNNQPSKGYGKRPVWQWVLIYVVLAVIVYGVAFVVYRHYHHSATGSSSSSSGLY